MQFIEGYAAAPSLPSGSNMQWSRSATLVWGISLPPKSPQKNTAFMVDAVGIPTSKNAREIMKWDESKYNDGYDSDGAMVPFLDAIADQTKKSVLDEDDALPASMLDGEEGLAYLVRPGEEPWFTTSVAINKLNVAQLKKEIQLRSLRPLGKKNELRKMMIDCMEQ